MSDFFKNLFQNSREGDSSAPIVGHLPEWFNKDENTTIVYNGPVGMWDFEHESAQHWFDGMSMLTSFNVRGNMVYMKKRFLKSDAYEKATANGKYITTEYATKANTDPGKNVVSKLMSSIVPGEMTDNGACNVYAFPTRPPTYVAASETCLLRPIDPVSLETGPKKIDLSSVVNIASARPITDPWSGELYNLSATFLTGLKYHFIKFGKVENDDPVDIADIPSTAKFVATIPSRMKTCFSYYHTFGLTENYLLMIEQPWVANSLKLIASKVKGLSFKDCLEWCPEERNVFHIIEKSSGNQMKGKFVSSTPFFFLNVINAYEIPGSVIVDVIGYDSPDILDQMYLSKLRENKFDVKDPSKILRYEVPIAPSPSKEKISLEPTITCTEVGCEHPTINPEYRGKPYRYAYVTGWLNSVNRGHFANSVTKVDMETGETVAWQGDTFTHPSEAVFIPNPDSASEDSGLIVASVTDVREDVKDFLLFLDARNMTEIGRASFDDQIPFSSHACQVRV